MDAVNLPVTAVITLMIGCTILAVAFVDGSPLSASPAPRMEREAAMSTVGERMISRAVAGAQRADVALLVKEARATYGAEGLPLLQEGADRLLTRSDDAQTRGMVRTLRMELDQIARSEKAAAIVAMDEQSAAPLSSGAEPNTDEPTLH
ncbi:MAG: hypothetical protein HQK87_05015 [Nitrospinae bacterium]|nr:hypothetical protein [Nitrospinota bacterium]